MGMDIYGIAPQTIGKQPQRPENWDSLTEYDKDMYYNDLDIWRSNNPGVYFRASCWSWRPIHAVCDFAINIAELPFSTSNWGYNDGGGLKTQEECDMLADAIGVYLTLNNSEMHDQDDTMYLCLGSWVTSSDKFVPRDLKEELNDAYPTGTILYRGVVTKDGTLAYPSHSCPLYHINNFVTFLRKCGGFEIW